jgi:lycopene cyclase domain-containing protein
MLTAEEAAVRRDANGTFHFRQGAWTPLWALLMVPYLVLWLPLCRLVGRSVDWKAGWITVLIFEALLMPAERYSLRRGHWVYNESRILGPKVFGVPIEEPLLYYLFSPLIIISIFHAFRSFFARKAARPEGKP